MYEKGFKEHKPSAPQLSEAEDDGGILVPVKAAEKESPAPDANPSESGHVQGVGGGGGVTPLSKLSSQKKGTQINSFCQKSVLEYVPHLF